MNQHQVFITQPRGGSTAAATSKMERFVIIVNGCKPLTIITKRSILDVAAVLDPPLQPTFNCLKSTIVRKMCEICSKLTIKTPEQCQ